MKERLEHTRSYVVRLILILLFASITGPVDAARYIPTESMLREVRAEAREEANLQAQREMVIYTARAFYAAAVSGAIGVLTLFALGWSMRQTQVTFSHSREVDQASRERDQASTRAYVHVDKVTFGKSGRPILYCKNILIKSPQQ